MAETFRTAKLERFVQKQVDHMNSQEKTLEMLREKKGSDFSDDVFDIVIMNKHARFEFTTELCEEFGIEMPEVLGGMEIEILEETNDD